MLWLNYKLKYTIIVVGRLFMEISYKNFIRTLLAALQFNEQALVDVHLVQKVFYKYSELPEYEDLFVNVSKTTDKHLQEYADIDNFEDEEPHLFLSFDVLNCCQDMCVFGPDNYIMIFKGPEVLDDTEASIFPRVNEMVQDYLLAFKKANGGTQR